MYPDENRQPSKEDTFVSTSILIVATVDQVKIRPQRAGVLPSRTKFMRLGTCYQNFITRLCTGFLSPDVTSLRSGLLDDPPTYRQRKAIRNTSREPDAHPPMLGLPSRNPELHFSPCVGRGRTLPPIDDPGSVLAYMMVLFLPLLPMSLLHFPPRNSASAKTAGNINLPRTAWTEQDEVYNDIHSQVLNVSVSRPQLPSVAQFSLASRITVVQPSIGFPFIEY
ncbi:hypothetical protein ACRALDRAFT_212295 [Sodiomyces alcalophilus JCM 7366]|uniref:uncharacterized protein n=1 Tax=Sodiomyces alcalophilus JCM 7366 TaxID=591952 RepID=UPI0039B4BAE4